MLYPAELLGPESRSGPRGSLHLCLFYGVPAITLVDQPSSVFEGFLVVVKHFTRLFERFALVLNVAHNDVNFVFHAIIIAPLPAEAKPGNRPERGGLPPSHQELLEGSVGPF